jgi:hypothetical protein
MPAATRPIRALVALDVLVLALALAMLGGCKGQSPPPAAEGKSVKEGGKAGSAPGRTLEDAKQRVDATEEKLQNRSDDMFEKSAGEKVERGTP